jgi:ketosteroid isomerase-like protein
VPDPSGAAGGAGVGDGFILMDPYLEPGPFETLAASLYRSRLLRKALLDMPQTSGYRRTTLLRFFAWCYRRWNEGRSIPYAVFAPDFELHQTAALIDSAGTFTGRRGLDEVREELSGAFADFTFVPHRVLELDPERLLFMVRFRAVGRGSGLELDRTVGHLFATRDGYASRMDIFWEESDALEAAHRP